MNATLGKKLRFSDAVYAIGTTPKSLRLWLQRGLVHIHTPKPEGGGWKEYSFIDIGILALTRQFVNFGVEVPVASQFANRILDETPRMLYLQHPEKMPAGALATLWMGVRARLYLRDDDVWQLDWSAAHEPLDEPSAAYLVVNVEAVLRTAFERADESSNEGAEDGAE